MRPPSPVAVGVAVAVLVVVGAGVAVAALAARYSDDTRDDGDHDGPVILYGDSLSWESSGVFEQSVAESSNSDVLVRAVPGSAICDVLDQLRTDVAELDPAVVVLEFVGNNASPCVEDLTGEALAERYAADAATATELLTEADIPVVWAGVPPAPGLPGRASELIDLGYRQLVSDWEGRDDGRVSYALSGETVTGPDGGFVAALPCLEDEGPAQGCRDGQIPVRSSDRIHFCPGLTVSTVACADYSSGSRRFGEAMAAGALRALEQGQPA